MGLITLDFIYLVKNYPSQNQKVVAEDYTVSAGGPATNAAITFSYLGHQSHLLGVGGSHPMMSLIQADFQHNHLLFHDGAPQQLEPPPISSIIVSEKTGDRTVISINSTRSQVPSIESTLSQLTPLISESQIILIDGHQMTVSQTILAQIKNKKIPIVVDGGSWKKGFETLLPHVNYVICSENFFPPHCHTEKEVFTDLIHRGIPNIAITHGSQPIQYYTQGQFGQIEIPKISVKDTLGAGDIFHGAFCYYILEQPFIKALHSAAQIAGLSCQGFGTRSWMNFPHQFSNNS